MAEEFSYTKEELESLYELARMYYEMGYFVPAEKIFNGLSAIDGEYTPAELGLGLLKLERGLYKESAAHFRSSLSASQSEFQAKLGLAAVYIAQSEFSRAQTVLKQMEKAAEQTAGLDSDLKKLFEALSLRCKSAEAS